MFGTHREWLRITAALCAALIAPGGAGAMPQTPAPAAQSPTAEAPKADAPKPRAPEQLDSLVAPIALYPDPLLAQVLAASTYPLEIVQANRWLKENTKLKGEELTKAAAKQPWDPSVQALVAFPEVLKRLDESLTWATELGNAFLEQQAELMDAVQRMRKKAKDGGKLQSTKEQKVEVKTVESKSVIVIEPSDPQVVYVPSYNPTVVYGPPPPAYAYPPYPYGAMAATAAVSFGFGVMMGAMWGGCCGGGGYGWGCSWGSVNNITINNNFNNRYGYASSTRTNVGSGNRSNQWQHNPAHRGSVPYGNRDTAERFGGSARDGAGRTERFDRDGRRDSASNRDRDTGGRDRGQAGSRDLGGDRGRGDSGRGDAGTRDRGGNQDRVGDRSFDSGSRGSDRSAFGGGSRERTQAASDRGFSSSRSSGASRSSGFSGGGGGRSFGGGGRSGGGRRR
jgi:hypothetical protein